MKETMLQKDDLVIVAAGTPLERKVYFSHYDLMAGKAIAAVFANGATSHTAIYNAVKDRYEFFNIESIIKSE